MGTITNIKAGLEARMTVNLSKYTKLKYQIDIEKNKFKGNKLAYSVLPSSAVEVDSLIGAFTLDQEFIYSFTNSFNNGAKSQLGDSLKVQRIQELMDDILTTYTDVQLNKTAVDSSVLVINSLTIGEPEYDESEKVIVIKWSVNVKYKTNIG